MVITRHRVAKNRSGRSVLSGWRRRREATLLAAAVAVTALGLISVYRGVLADSRPAAPGSSTTTLVVLERGTAATALLPLLDGFGDPGERAFVADRLVRAAANSPLRNVGELARLRVERSEIESRKLPTLDARLAAAADGDRPAASTPLLDSRQLSRLRAGLAVRRPATFRNQLALWSLVALASLLLVHVVWQARGFRGDQVLLPVLVLLSGIGLCAMVAVRDPLRDLLLFRSFAQGIAGGAALLLAASLLDIERSRLPRIRFLALLAAAGLSLLLIVFGSGPGGSDAKVNLLGAQPVEAIKLLVVLFLAGYFSQRWELLRELHETRSELPGPLGRLRLPRLDYLAPPLVATAAMLGFFFLQRDLGPALVISLLFLGLYTVARGRVVMTIVALALLVAGFAVGYQIRFPRTVAARVDMWMAPWDNVARGGEHLAHSLWAFASGGLRGTGLGRGGPEFVPEVHTDLVLAAVGEELGAVGLLVVVTGFGVILLRGARAALRTGASYSFFLALGLTLVLALELLLIAAGVLGLLPLTGVVTPFLSYGRSAMLVNFLIVGLLVSISARPAISAQPAISARPAAVAEHRVLLPAARRVVFVAGLLLLWVAVRATTLQVMGADAVVVRGALAIQGDGVRRRLYNPRLLEIAQSVPRGVIVDRNGIVLATSDVAELEPYRATYQRLELDVANLQRPGDRTVEIGERTYPLGGYTFHLLGDLNRRTNWTASNTSFIERDLAVRLQGWDDRPRDAAADPQERDLRELVPLLRGRGRRPSALVRAFYERDRTVRLTLDARLQKTVGDALAQAVQRAGQRHGAAVVIDVSSGDLLASVSVPWPDLVAGAGSREATLDPDGALLDRARYGLFPPGSTFKLVTAIAALRGAPETARETYSCQRLPGGRVGHAIRGWKQPIRDDPSVTSPHGTIDLWTALVRSCNAYFAQLATSGVGASALLDTAARLGIEIAQPNTVERARDLLPQAGYGQGQVLATPFEMARVAATIAAGGELRLRGFGLEPEAPGSATVERLLDAAQAQALARAMRRVVTEGSGAMLRDAQPAIAGKTGTAQVTGGASHSWFVGFAPASGEGRAIAFSILIEHGGYGGVAAARVAREIVAESTALGLVD